jgi:hypothetical protein
MPLDTENNRRSTLGCSILPLTVYFTPDGSINQGDRRHATALYRPIVSQRQFFFRWIPEQNSSSTYRCEQDNSITQAPEQNSSISSSEEQNTSSTYRCEQDSSLDCNEQENISED